MAEEGSVEQGFTAGEAAVPPPGKLTVETTLRQRLRDAGLRLTPQRELILAAVDRLEHATPDEVLALVRESSEAINLSTVYRTLETLEELGLVRHAHLGDRAQTYHSTAEHEHFHLICRNCERVISVDPDVATPFARTLREQFAFEADLAHLTVFGTCTDCAAVETPGHGHGHGH